MRTETPKDREIERNYHYFKSQVDDLMAEHEGAFALLRHQEIVGYFDDWIDALDEGRRRFADDIYSVQEVRTEPYFISAI